MSAFHESVELEMELVVEYSLFTGSYIMEMRFGVCILARIKCYLHTHLLDNVSKYIVSLPTWF